MKQLTMKGKVFDVPEKMSEIKLKDFKDIIKIDPIKLNPAQYNSILASTILKETEEFFKTVKMTEFKELMGIFETYKSEKLPDETADTLTINDMVLTRINLEDITVGEWIDLNSYLSGNIFDNLEYIVSIIYRPLGEEYDFNKCKERAPLFNSLEIGTIYGSISFFSHLNKIS